MFSNSSSHFSRIRQARGLALVACLYAGSVLAQPSASDFTSIPPLIADTAPPNVMLVMSNDHELYKKAYTDYSDLDGDGVLDTSYVDGFTYTGYFDSNFCYSYSSGRFEPAGDISAQIATDGHRCDLSGVSGDWSGNFLNWAAMTRADIVKTVLYGGTRAVDTATSGMTPGVTVLERVFLPEDIHAFVKVYEGATERFTPYTESAVSLCNITYGATGNAPLIRVAYGAWPQWSASEVVQCHYRHEDDSLLGNQPTSSDRPLSHDFNALIQVCKVGVDSGSRRCKAYTHGSTGDVTYKPVGLLQRHGDNATMNFGLMTGSYNEKIRGGVLRKNILPLTGNTDSSNDEVDLNTGQFINQGTTDAGIVNTLDRFQIVNWNYTSNNYSDCNTHSITIDTFKTSTSGNRQCRNWGNPLSEIYLEALRYFTGDEVPTATAGNGVPTTDFNVTDEDQIANLPKLDWNDPLRADNACATCSIIVISTGLNSFDKDNLGTVTDLWDEVGSSRLSLTELDNLVDEVGDLEGITNGTYLIGNNDGSADNNSCTAKVVAELSDAVGLCPEIPSMEGGFDIAGLAFHARNNDLRDSYDGIQNVTTFSVAVAESLPSFELDVNGDTVSFVPTCQASTNGSLKLDQGGWNDCSLVDLIVESSSPTSGRILIAWEDSHWGNDYDMDGVVRLEYCIGTDTSSCPDTPSNLNLGSGYNWSDFTWKTSGLTDDTVQFRMSVPQANAGNALRFGYIISGVTDQVGNTDLVTNTPSSARNNWPTTSGGQYIARGVLGNGEQSFLLRQGGYTISRLNSNSGNRIIYHEPAVYTASDSVNAGRRLNNPLWYAAKYGSFNDLDGDGTPRFNGSSSDTREWDVRNTVGETGADGIPDNYFPVRNPSELIVSLSQIFQVISERISSGTAAAVVANSSTGLGAVYQAYYHPNYTDPESRTLAWGGVLHAMFIDESGRFREDNGTKGQLDGTGTDFVIDIYYDQTVVPNRTRFQRYLQSGSGPTATLAPLGSPEDLEEIGSIWNARDVLADMSQSNMVLQRSLSAGTYSEAAQDKRYIFTFLDSISAGTVGEVDSGEVVDFLAATFDPGSNNNHRYMGLANPSLAPDLVDFIRGQDQAGWRSRLVDIPGDGVTTAKHWVLGDIVHSSPLVVNPPSQRYDVQFADETYAAFKQQYSRRRQMVYAGANDGMLHAFNGGVWDPATQTFHNQAWDSGTESYTSGPSHTLGAEMWAYVPMNLLPHLQWLTDEEYDHVYYMDAPPQAYDVNIFPDDAIHPDGWGTILVVGMRLGGGSFPVDLDGDSFNDTTMRSAYVILDITDPERPPTLIAEITEPDLGFTTSMPTLVKTRRPNAISGTFATPAANRWMLLFGSGPDTLSTATSSRDAKIYAYDLVAREAVSIHSNSQVPTSDPNGYFGDLLTVDWGVDYQDDVVYAGTVEGTEFAPSGRMKRIVLADALDMGLSIGTAVMSDVINVGQPVTARASTRVEVGRNERWLSFGTGRLFTRNDNMTTTPQSFYGIKEADNYNTTGLTAAALVNTTSILVESNGAIHDGSVGNQVTIDSTDLGSFTELYSFMDSYPGWVRNLGYNGSDPSERVFSGSLVLGSTVVYSSYIPNVDICTIEGSGFLTAVNFRTGTAEVFSPLGADEDGVVFTSISLGQGAPSTPAAIVRTGVEPVPGSDSSGGDLSIVTGSTTGVTESTGFTAAPGSGGRMSWEILEIPF